ncbi:hypothetical protein GCM10007880_68020 [Mesorhizobium amorphae]|nr:hypothetical protein GCM10007880_68020 [Mesorhizobium amorphae]
MRLGVVVHLPGCRRMMRQLQKKVPCVPMARPGAAMRPPEAHKQVLAAKLGAAVERPEVRKLV